MKYNRILLKLSGESLMGSQSYGISPEMLTQYALDIKGAVEVAARSPLSSVAATSSAVSAAPPKAWTACRATTWA